MTRGEYRAGEEDGGRRIDLFLNGRLVDWSRSAVQRLIEAGHVTLKGAAVKKSHQVLSGEVFTVEFPPPAPTHLAPQDIPLDIVWEDGDIAVVNKPRGMVVHPAPGHAAGTLVNALLHHCGDSLSGVGGAMRPGVVHRLDKDTSGLIIVAKNDFAHLCLSRQLKDRSLSRVYEAIVRGRFQDAAGKVDVPVGRHGTDRKRMAATAKNGKSAVTHYQMLREYAGYTHVRCKLETGRTHQIRVHMAHIGHPLLGDPVYGEKSGRRAGGQYLHAREIGFAHPRGGERMCFSTQLPDYFQEALSRLEKGLMP